MSALKVAMNAGFNVVATIADNHVVNRQFFKDFLCGGDLKPFAPNPLNRSLNLFILIDPTHTLKNLFNNFQKSRGFVIPPGGSFGPYSPKFLHIRQLYELESLKMLRMAHKLTTTCLQPTNIQRTSAKLTFSVFDESTASAMKYYSLHEQKQWVDTASFLQDMSILFKIVNVKNSKVGFSKRDIYRQPILSPTDEKLQLLKDYADFFRTWKDSKSAGLTHETFTACILMCEALPSLARHLLDSGFNYVLLGHMQTDELEHRFGRYRQLCGANYFISVKQLMESEKKLKITSLLKHTMMSPLDLSTISEENSDSDTTMTTFASEKFDFDGLKLDLDYSELEVLCFVSGYVAKSVLQKFSCESCLRLMVADEDLPEVECDSHSHFFDIVNRGGLKKPSDSLFILCCYAYSIFAHIKQSTNFSSFLTHNNPASLFCLTVTHVLENFDRGDLVQLTCHSMHFLVNPILRCFFNILAKNFVKNYNSQPNHSGRKIAKLQSHSA